MKTSVNIQVLYINMELQIVYHTQGLMHFTDAEKFNNVLIQEKNKIASRDYVLNRFEPWEVNSIKSLKMLLISRSRNQTEKQLVTKYIGHLTAGE